MQVNNDILYITENRENAYVSYESQKLPYEFSLTTPGLAYDEMAETLTLDAVQFSADGAVPGNSVFIEVNKIDSTNGSVNVCGETIELDIYGVGLYSFASSPAIISAADEYIEILVHTGSHRVQLVAQLFVRPVLFEF